MLNVDIDPRGGFYTRKGWHRWNEVDVIDPISITWAPRNAFSVTHANNNQDVYVVNNHIVYWASDTAVFAALPTIVGNASPHQASFVAWGQNVYVATGSSGPTYRVSATHTVTAMTPETWSEVDAPTSNTVPHAEYLETHASYLFAACMTESDGNHFSRIRWSHPDRPDSFDSDDFIDIDAGGGKITNLISYNDHLLIFKTNSIWALYGYELASWQLVKVSTSIGCPAPTACTRSEKAVYFYSASDRGGVYGYNGSTPVYLSENLRPAFEQVFNFDNVFVSWAGRRLWVGVPWVKDIGSTVVPTTCFVMDADIGAGGAWTMYRSDFGAIGPVLDGSDVNAKYPLAAMWSASEACLVTLDYLDTGFDIILKSTLLVTGGLDLIVTGDGKTITVTGVAAQGDRFDAYYRTRWLHGGWPDRKKSWRRPTFICRHVPAQTDLLVETFRDYNETSVQRTRTLHLRSVGNAYWTEDGFAANNMGGFDWTEGGIDDVSGRGANWGSAIGGSTLERAGSQGLAKAVQMRIRASPTTPMRKWGVDGIVAKIVMRRFR
jgi:hypothetical protein